MGEFRTWIEEQLRNLEARANQTIQEHFQLLGAVLILREVLAKSNEFNKPQDAGGAG